MAGGGDERDGIADAGAEGDVNLSPNRRAWQDANIGPETRALLDADSRHFLHQSLSTPCMDALVEAVGIYLVDLEGRRYIDTHGSAGTR